MEKVLERPAHIAIQHHIRTLSEIKASYEKNIAGALEAIQSTHHMKDSFKTPF
ncbi:hypothetical protein WJR50_07795 [Catalinimonas sp. 4WD22]|uniref:hypothetical protein n=1 Tax=Catalinimonas locisalis TaxID=3133978 RepID=UPI00310177A8